MSILVTAVTASIPGLKDLLSGNMHLTATIMIVYDPYRSNWR